MPAALALAAPLPAPALADTTAPVITRSVTGPGGEAGWFRGPVNVRWTVFDPESAWTTTGCDAVTISVETPGVPLQCRADSAGGTSIDAFVVRIDTTPPVASGAAPGRPPDRRGWYRAPVSVAFTGADVLSGVAACSVVPYSGPDRRRAVVSGWCADVAGNQSAPAAFRLRYDATGPTGIRHRPARRPNRRGWFTRPVRFRFRARDRLSGHAHCRPVTYRGPDGRGRVQGACSDRAGNVSTRAFPIRYDATAPTARLRVLAGHRMAVVRWRAAADARSFRLDRWIRGRSWTRRVIYRGHRHRHVDRGVLDGLRYRYRLVVVDRAGHRTARTRGARPHRGLLAPRRGARVTAPPLLRWTPVLHARYYNVQIARDGQRVLAAWPGRPRYRIPPAWTWAGQPQALTPGTYTWYVWSGVGKRARHRYGPLIGHRRFTVLPMPAG